MLPENNLVIKIGQTIINFFNSYNHLGTQLDPTLLFNTYFDKIYKKHLEESTFFDAFVNP